MNFLKVKRQQQMSFMPQTFAFGRREQHKVFEKRLDWIGQDGPSKLEKKRECSN